jgi:hypothetical protein
MKPNASGHRAVCGGSLPKVIACVSIMLLVVWLLAALMGRAHENSRTAGLWMESLDLSLPAFWLAGTPLRHPFALVPAVDLRYSPLIPVDCRPVIDSVCNAAANGLEPTP